MIKAAREMCVCASSSWLCFALNRRQRRRAQLFVSPDDVGIYCIFSPTPHAVPRTLQHMYTDLFAMQMLTTPLSISQEFL